MSSSSNSWPQSTDRVKLNNPLMGTEIIDYPHGDIIIQYHSVKLNNPLMGTEMISGVDRYTLSAYNC